METVLTLGNNPLPLTTRELGEMADCMERSARPNLVRLSMDIRDYLDGLEPNRVRLSMDIRDYLDGLEG